MFLNASLSAEVTAGISECLTAIEQVLGEEKQSFLKLPKPILLF